MIKKIINKLKIKVDINLNSDERFIFHKKNLENKPLLQSCYNEFYEKIIELEKKFLDTSLIEKKKIEIGSGVGFIKKFDQKIITSDIIKNPLTDMQIDACNLPFDDNSISTLIGIFCFHHFSDPNKFLIGITNKLAKGGVCILIEPYYGLFARYFYKKVHDTEYFNENEDFDQLIKYKKTSMENANQAMSYIFFKKNVRYFKKNYPNLSIKYEYVFSNYLRFLFSGGLNFRSLLPSFSKKILKILEILLFPIKKFLGLHYIIVIKKN
jgi:SAM-dependent methyltransferase